MRRAESGAEPAVTDSAALRDLAASLAREAGAIALAGRRSLPTGNRIEHDTKSSIVDPVTEFDRAAEQLIVERLQTLRPGDAIVGEEGARHAGTTGVEWHVDPIDGTVNFLYDLPGWCTSIAAVHDGEPIAGAIYAPVTAELFIAAAGHGAALVTPEHPDGVPIHASAQSELNVSLVSTGFSYDVGAHREAQAQRVLGVLTAIRDVRRIGSAALDLAAVACGRVEAYYEEHLNSWDIAAGAIIVREAGGVVTAFDGSRLDVAAPAGILAGGPRIHGPLDDLLRRLDPDAPRRQRV